jgi:hypothetical protein
MKITERQLRKIIREELEGQVAEAEKDSTASSEESASNLTDQQKKQLNDLSKSPPTSLAGFSKNLKLLAGIIDDIDAKAANINSSQLGQYWPQVMSVISKMMSEEKTSSTETGKVAKALD